MDLLSLITNQICGLIQSWPVSLSEDTGRMSLQNMVDENRPSRSTGVANRGPYFSFFNEAPVAGLGGRQMRA